MSENVTIEQYRKELRTSRLEDAFAGQLRALFIEQGWDQRFIEREFVFDESRKWRADFRIGSDTFHDDYFDVSGTVPPVFSSEGIDYEYGPIDLLIEIEGGVIRKKDGTFYTRGRHVWGKGYRDDIDKLNAAAMLGYTVLRFTKDMIDDGIAIETVRRALIGEDLK